MRRLLTVLGALAGVIAAGWSSLRPPTMDGEGLWAWARTLGPARTVAAAVWVACVAVGGYLVVLGLLMWICRGRGDGRAVRMVVRLVPGPFRLLVCTAVGLSATAVSLAGTAGASTVPAPPVLKPAAGRLPPSTTAGSPVLRRLPTPSAATSPSPAVPRSASPPTTSTAGTAPTGPRMAASPPASPSIPPTSSPPTPAPAPLVGTWVIRPGDHLWRVAQQTLSETWGRTPDTRAVGRYWWTLVELNRPHLPDPGNPDLVFTGDVIALPPIPAP